MLHVIIRCSLVTNTYTWQYTFQHADEDFEKPDTDDGFNRVLCSPTATDSCVGLSLD